MKKKSKIKTRLLAIVIEKVEKGAITVIEIDMDNGLSVFPLKVLVKDLPEGYFNLTSDKMKK
jgi:hypothetical protein